MLLQQNRTVSDFYQKGKYKSVLIHTSLLVHHFLSVSEQTAITVSKTSLKNWNQNRWFFLGNVQKYKNRFMELDLDTRLKVYRCASLPCFTYITSFLCLVGVGFIYGHIWNILAFLLIYLSTYIYSCYILHHSAVTRVQLLCLVEAGSKWPYWAFYFSSFCFIFWGVYIIIHISYITSNKSATFKSGRPGMEMAIFGPCDIIYS